VANRPGCCERRPATMEIIMPFSLRKSLFVLCVAGLGGCLTAQTPCVKAPTGAAAKKSAFDKAELEFYLRHRNLCRRGGQVEIGDPKPSQQLPGMLEVTVRLTWSGGSLDDLYLVSKDGQKIVKGDVSTSRKTVQAGSGQAQDQFQPSFGTPGASVVIALFGDFECPACKPEAKMLRDNLLSAFPTQVRLYFKDYRWSSFTPGRKWPPSPDAALYRQNPLAFWNTFDWIYAHQDEITTDNLQSKVVEFAKGKENDIDVLRNSRAAWRRARAKPRWTRTSPTPTRCK